MPQLQANCNIKYIYLPAVERNHQLPSPSCSSGEDDHLKMYSLCIKSIVSRLDSFHPNLHCLPVNIQIDLYHEVFMNELWTDLNFYLSNLNNFVNLLMFNKGQRQTLHMLVQRLMDEGLNITEHLRKAVIKDINSIMENSSSNSDADESDSSYSMRLKAIQRAYALAGFFIEAGWYVDAEKILSDCFRLYVNVIDNDDLVIESWIFRIKTRLLAALIGYSRFKEANQLHEEMVSLINEKNYADLPDKFHLAQAYNQFACLFSAQSLYKKAYSWSCLSMAYLTSSTPRIALIDILLTTTKCCVTKRDFEIADFLLRQALLACKELFQLNEKCDFSNDKLDNSNERIASLHPILGDLFMAMGYYYHNIDMHATSVKFYLNSVNFRKQYFGLYTPTEQCINLPLALARQELAFESYIQEYSTGHFDTCMYHADLAKISLETLLPKEHHLLSNVYRIKALIIEEQAIDNMDLCVKTEMLMEANKLHREALKITRSILGEENLQTAKNYSNLGRLYQTMHRYDDSEMLQLRSIEIKEKCLGKDDYEVAQSYGFLASLYSYDMEMYPQAENYYIKAIDIGTKTFGGAYSGLEIDYQGIIRIYNKTGNTEKADEYVKLLRSWKLQRYSIAGRLNKIDLCTSLTDESLAPFNIKDVKQYFSSNRLHQV